MSSLRLDEKKWLTEAIRQEWPHDERPQFFVDWIGRKESFEITAFFIYAEVPLRADMELSLQFFDKENPGDLDAEDYVKLVKATRTLVETDFADEEWRKEWL